MVFDTIVGFIIYTGCDPHNTLQGKGRMAMTRKSTNDARCIMIVLALVEFFFSSFFFRVFLILNYVLIFNSATATPMDIFI